MGKHKPDCRNKSCSGCGPDSDLNKANKRIKALEKAIEFVILWNDNSLGASVSVPEVNEYLRDAVAGKLDDDDEKSS
jgi:hypothetical protein